MPDLCAYTRFPTLASLPALIRKQRGLEAKIAPIEPLVEKEKAVRKEIDALLIKAGFARNEGVTCLGYDVVHNDRKGATSLNATTLVQLLVAAGLDEGRVLKILIESTDTGDPPQWATVKPSKGSKVRT